MGKGKEVLQVDRLYQYLSVDGVARLRCGRHVHTEEWGRPQHIWQVWPLGRRLCVECEHERRELVHLAEPEENEVWPV